MCRACSMQKRGRKYFILDRKPIGKRPIRWCTPRQEDNIKVKVAGCGLHSFDSGYGQGRSHFGHDNELSGCITGRETLKQLSACWRLKDSAPWRFLSQCNMIH
jgi:hypothetical protein